MLLCLALPPILFTTGPADRPQIELLKQTTRPLVSGFFATADPEPSFDARRVLFSGKKTAAERWRIHELDLASGKVRTITSGEADARHPAYQSRFFTLDAPTPWDQVVFVSGGQLHTCTLEGKDCHQITFHEPGAQAGPPSVAWDGRVLYPLTTGGRTRLFGVNLDGTDVALFSPEEVDAARVAPGREHLYAARGGQLRRLSLLRPSLGGQPLGINAADPEQLGSGEVLAAADHTILAVTAGGAARVVYRSASPVRQPRALARREPPDGRGSVVDPAADSGALYCLSAWTSEHADAPKARRVRIHLPQGPPVEKDLASDGSFLVTLPANTPLTVETLDAAGRPLLRSAPFWVRNKENRGCIGCHENPELTPENRFAEALRRSPR